MTDLEKLKYIKTSLEQQCMLAIRSTSVVEDRLDIEKTYYSQIQTFENAISALEKQIPKKPIRANRAIEKDGRLFMNDDNEYWKCPICTDYDVPLRENQRYCHYCGQVLDWSDISND